MTPPSSHACVSFFYLLLLVMLPAQYAAISTHVSYKLGSRQETFFKTPAGGRSSTWPRATTNTLCTGAGLGNNKLLPVVHRQSAWSTASDVLGRVSSQSSVAPAPAPSSTATTIRANSTSDSRRLGKMDFRVIISFGTPEQKFPVLLDTGSIGVSLLQCKPCASGSDDCGLAFDTTRSSTFAHVLCGSPECPTNCSTGSICPFDNLYSSIMGTYAEDVLTLAPSMAVHDFRFVCLDVDDEASDFLPETGGILDLSRDRNSLPSRLGGADPATFSYCLPNHPSSRGFLSLGGDANFPNDELNLTAHAPLVSSADPKLSNMYFIDLVGISLAGEDLPFPAGTFGGNTSAKLDVGNTFTMLAPEAYAVLRDAFRKEISQYNDRSVPGFAGFDTCYNFTGLHGLSFPTLQFKFSNGENLEIEDQLLYYEDPTGGGFGLTCLAFSSLNAGGDVFSAVIGTYTLGSMEVVYDVAGGKVVFFPLCC